MACSQASKTSVGQDCDSSSAHLHCCADQKQCIHPPQASPILLHERDALLEVLRIR